MITKAIFYFILFISLTIGCKDEPETIMNRDFIEINGDKRIMGANTTMHIMVNNEGYTFEINDTQYSKEIAGYPIDRLQFRVIINDSKLLSNNNTPSNKNYPLVDLNNRGLADYARININLSKIGYNKWYYLNSYFPSGDLKVSEVKGRKVLEFSNIKLLLGDSLLIPVNGRFEF